MAQLNGKVAIVTGGASGIGLATTRRFVEEGARVVVGDINTEAGKALEQELGPLRIAFVHANLKNAEDAELLAATAHDRFQRIDILVNNAAARRYTDILGTTAETWDEMLAVNVRGYALCARAAIPVMIRSGGGSIVNVASIRSTLAGRNMVEYNTTKAAIVGLTGSLAFDHAHQNIRVNTLSPGPVFTEFHRARASASGSSEEEFKREFGKHGMLGRPADPVEIANCVVFLASDFSSFVTGTNLFADGGVSVIDGTR